MTDEDFLALRHGVGAVELPRDFVALRGADAVGFLQGQLSQDVAAMEVGASAESLVLQPTGKVDAWVRVTRVGPDEVVLDVEGGWGEALINRLNRFKLRVKADLEPRAWRCVALRGPASHEVDLTDVTGRAVAADWPAWPGVDLLGADVVVPDGVRLCSFDAWEAVRIEAGVPRMGSELDERTIPAEAGIVERTVSFTKGCFTGQELVARIDSRGGNVPRRLRAVVVAAGEGPSPPVGCEVVVGPKVVGTLTSVAPSPEGGTVALAYVGRAVEPPAEVVLRWAGGERSARIEALPPA